MVAFTAENQEWRMNRMNSLDGNWFVGILSNRCTGSLNRAVARSAQFQRSGIHVPPAQYILRLQTGIPPRLSGSSRHYDSRPWRRLRRHPHRAEFGGNAAPLSDPHDRAWVEI